MLKNPMYPCKRDELAIGHVKADSGPIQISTWTETDFRTGLAPWWK